tara:strand:+ start:4250 stop:4729 length:480 start_codon:yes stop_codon:yes gene_type:complete
METVCLDSAVVLVHVSPTAAQETTIVSGHKPARMDNAKRAHSPKTNARKIVIAKHPRQSVMPTKKSVLVVSTLMIAEVTKTVQTTNAKRKNSPSAQAMQTVGRKPILAAQVMASVSGNAQVTQIAQRVHAKSTNVWSSQNVRKTLTAKGQRVFVRTTSA